MGATARRSLELSESRQGFFALHHDFGAAGNSRAGASKESDLVLCVEGRSNIKRMRTLFCVVAWPRKNRKIRLRVPGAKLGSCFCGEASAMQFYAELQASGAAA